MWKYKIQLLSILSIVVCIATPMILFHDGAKKIIIERAGIEAKNVALSIETFLEQDMARYRILNDVDLIGTEAFDEAYYQEMLTVFQSLKEKTDADYIFTEKIVMDTQIVYILDGQPIESEDFSAIGTTDSVGEVELGVYKSGVAASTGLIMDPEWGNYVTGFAPIWDVENNEIIGLVGVDHSAEYIIEFMKKVDFTLVLLFCILTSVLSILSIILINQHAKQLRKDFLTGLNNRRAFDAMLAAMIKRYDRKKMKFCVLMIDVDKFKQINDTYGHVVGDLVLKWVAEHISIGTINEDYIFRFGGDEFVIILPDHSEEDAAFIAKQLQDEFLGKNLYIAKDQPIILEISVGIAEYHENSSMEAFLNEADENMYKIKTAK